MNKEQKKQITIFDRVEVYRDFIINLTHHIFEYYIDDGSFDKEDVDKFFDWCYDRVCDEFKEEDIDFSQNFKVKKYFKEYFHVNYFYADDEYKKDKDHYINFWKNIFDAKSVENKKLFLAFVELYSYFDESINEKIKEGVGQDL